MHLEGLGLRGDQVGRIDVNEFSTYVAVDRAVAREVAKGLNTAKVKGKSVKARRL